MSDYRHRTAHLDATMRAVAVLLVLIALAWCAPVWSADQYPFPPATQRQLLERTAALYMQWPKGRPLPSPGVVWRSPEWFAVSRGLTERAAWGTVDGHDVVLNEAMLKHPFLSQEPVRSSLLVHEYVHILQRDLQGPVRDCADLARREMEAYLVQAAYLRQMGQPLVLSPETHCEANPK